MEIASHGKKEDDRQGFQLNFGEAQKLGVKMPATWKPL